MAFKMKGIVPIKQKKTIKSPTKHGKRVTPIKHGRGRKGHTN